jgi:hypothetical protein
MKTFLTNVVLFKVLPALAAAALFLGCNTAPFTPGLVCEYKGTTVYIQSTIESNKVLANCAYFQGVIDQAITTDSQFIPTEDLNKILDGLQIWVHQDNASIVCQGVTNGEWGCNEDVHFIETNSAMGSLAHEMLHSYDRIRGVPLSDTLVHKGWNTNAAPAGAASYTVKAFSAPVLDGSWWDVTERLMSQETGQFVDTFCPNTGGC